MKTFQFLTVCLLFLFQQIDGQKIVSLGVNVNPGYSWLSAPQTNNFEGFIKKNSIKLNYGLTAQYYLNKKISFLSGLQLVGYGFEIQAESYEIRFQAMDSEKKQYVRIISGKGITETSSLVNLQIPMCVVHEISVSRDFRIFVSAGPSLAIPVSSHIKSEGIFSYKGYYSDGNFTLENLPLYGFSSDVEVQKDGKLDTKFLSIHGLASAGCIFNINRYWRFTMDVNYIRSITSPVKLQGEKYYLTNGLGSFYSMLGSRSASLNNFSVGLSIRKNILM